MELTELISLLELDINKHGTMTTGSEKLLHILKQMNNNFSSLNSRVENLENATKYTEPRG